MKTKKSNNKILSILLAASVALTSCSKDDNEDSPEGPINNANVAAQIDEYPRSGDFIVTAESKLSGDLNFTLTKVSVNDAFILNETSGQLTAANPFAFDYETNTEITGEITVTNGTESEVLSLQVDINNIDDIAYFLKGSKEAYLAASPGDWVPITSDEYLTLSIEISGTNRSGTTENLYEAGVVVEVFDTYDDFTVANDAAPIPVDNYVYAFKFWSDASNTNGNRVKVSGTSLTEGYEDLGNSLPTGGRGEQSFVLKGSNDPTTSTGYLGMYSQSGLAYDVRGNAPGEHYFVQGNTGTIGNNFNIVQRICLYQGLSTSIKQWD
ncbi:cadherin repeat domain-containing protein [Poritiphilus flavus]|uniref:Cadherin domain-containing protein n=1 Tax=Poritiphilus flavus TaxID=2697053 RepID=A0A6L9EEH9_9FLAO|nr:cadherin repeat domain-containing protein [Poritiphilus flavus]NAS13160.1 hypothetical protein [Poritiphilus flavus]